MLNLNLTAVIMQRTIRLHRLCVPKKASLCNPSSTVCHVCELCLLRHSLTKLGGAINILCPTFTNYIDTRSDWKQPAPRQQPMLLRCDNMILGKWTHVVVPAIKSEIILHPKNPRSAFTFERDSYELFNIENQSKSSAEVEIHKGKGNSNRKSGQCLKTKASYHADAYDVFFCVNINTFYSHLCKNGKEHFDNTNADGPLFPSMFSQQKTEHFSKK